MDTPAIPKQPSPFVPRFQLRTLMLLILVISVGIVWWQDRRELTERVTQLELALFELRKRNAPSFSPIQVLGKPDTPTAGDQGTAWASATADSSNEWLILTYPRSVRPSEVIVHENFKPGAVTKVSLLDGRGKETVVWKGIDPTPASAAKGISRIPINTRLRTRKIKVYIDSKKILGFNEIDAVGLRDNSGNTQWAIDAKASSSYGSASQYGRFIFSF